MGGNVSVRQDLKGKELNYLALICFMSWQHLLFTPRPPGEFRNSHFWVSFPWARVCRNPPLLLCLQRPIPSYHISDDFRHFSISRFRRRIPTPLTPHLSPRQRTCQGAPTPSPALPHQPSRPRSRSIDKHIFFPSRLWRLESPVG